MIDFVKQEVEPLHLQIAAHLKEKILSGELRPESKLPPTEALAASFGTTGVTIQKSLQHLVQLDLIERYPRRGTFIKHSVAANTIGLVFGYSPYHDRHPFYAMVAAMLRDMGEAMGINVKVYFSLNEKLDERNIFDIREDLNQGKLRGLIAIRRSPELSTWLEEQRDLFWLDLPGCDYRSGVQQTVQHLREQGYQRIRVVSIMPQGTLPGDMACLHESECAGVDAAFGGAAPAGTVQRWGQTEADGYHACRRLFSGPMEERPDALFVNHDIVSRGALFALMELGVRIPRELAFATHANRGCDILSPVPLTRIEYDPADAVRACLEVVQAHFKKAKTGRHTFTQKIPGTLHVGGSTLSQPHPPRDTQ